MMNENNQQQAAMLFNVNAPIIIAAILMGMALIYHALRTRGLACRRILLFMATAWTFGLIFGKLFYLMNDWLSYRAAYADASQWFASVSYGGIITFALYGYASVGGIAGAMLGTWLFSRWSRQSFIDILDGCALPVLVMYGIVRIGCAAYGCCYGIEIAEPHVPLMQAILAHAGGRWLFPVQWLDCFTTLAVCLFIAIRSRHVHTKAPRLRLTLLMYPLQRILLEFLRGDPGRGMIWIFSTTQVMFLIIWIAGIALFHYSDKKNCSISQEQSR